MLWKVGFTDFARYSSRFSGFVPENVLATYDIPNDSRGQIQFLMSSATGDDVVARRVWYDGLDNYERPVPEILIGLSRDVRRFVFVGANTGFFVLLAAVAAPTSSVTAIEPYERAQELLARNIALNNLERRIEVLPIALSDINGEGAFYLPPANFGSTVETSGTLSREFHSTIATAQPVEIHTLDSVLLNHEEAGVDLLHIDVEGHEGAVLAGGLEVLRRHRPHIFVEILADRGADVHRINEVCRESNYFAFQLHKDALIQGESVTPCHHAPDQWLVPAERVEDLLVVAGNLSLDVQRPS